MYTRKRRRRRKEPTTRERGTLLCTFEERGNATAGKNKDGNSGNYRQAERDGDIHHPRSFEYRGSEEQPTRRRTGEERGDEESLITERGGKEKLRSWNEVREGARKRGEDRWRKGVGGKGREG